NAEPPAALDVEAVPFGVPPRAHEDEEIRLALAPEKFVARLRDLFALSAHEQVAPLRQRRDECDRADAAELLRGEHHPRIPGMQRKGEHAAAKFGDATVMVNRTEVFEQQFGLLQRFWVRRFKPPES